MPEKTVCYIGLGTNLGDRDENIRQALELLAKAQNVELCRVSDIIETAPLGEGPKFLNAVAQIKTTLTPQQLFTETCEIENSLGRVRDKKWTPRTIDLDILLFGKKIIETDKLSIPHSQLHLRSFVLKGICQLDGQLTHPVLNETAEKLLQRLNGGDFSLDPNRPQLISVAGIIGVGKTTLVNKLTDTLSCDRLLEPYDENPFLKKVYAGQKNLSLDSQLFFLTERVKQLSGDNLTLGRLSVSDYIFEKEMIYAGLLLDSEQFALYGTVYRNLVEKVLQPALVIYLADSADNCLQRIYNRNRPYEQKIELEFLGNLVTAYERLFKTYKRCPVVRIEMPDFDSSREDDIKHLIKQIKAYITNNGNS